MFSNRGTFLCLFVEVLLAIARKLLEAERMPRLITPLEALETLWASGRIEVDSRNHAVAHGSVVRVRAILRRASSATVAGSA